jgi:acetoacetyl-[acyl-carrier protein] synthase
MIAGAIKPVYKFDHGVLGDADVELDAHQIRVAGQPVSLDLVSVYEDMRPAAD